MPCRLHRLSLHEIQAPIPKGVAYLEAVIHRYEAAVAAACKSVAACRYDGGAFGRVADRPRVHFVGSHSPFSSRAGEGRSRRLGGTEEGWHHPELRLSRVVFVPKVLRIQRLASG